MVFQHSALFDSLTVGDNVGFLLREHSSLAPPRIKVLALGAAGVVRSPYRVCCQGCKCCWVLRVIQVLPLVGQSLASRVCPSMRCCKIMRCKTWLRLPGLCAWQLHCILLSKPHLRSKHYRCARPPRYPALPRLDRCADMLAPGPRQAPTCMTSSASAAATPWHAQQASLYSQVSPDSVASQSCMA